MLLCTNCCRADRSLLRLFLSGGVLLFALANVATASTSIELCLQAFPSLDTRFDVEVVATPAEWQYVIECAATDNLNILQAISYFAPLLRDNNLRITITGDVVNEVATRYDYGYLVQSLMIPVGYIDSIHIGFVDNTLSSEQDRVELEIFLNSLPPPHIQQVRFIGRTEIQVQYHYGFAVVNPDNLMGGFGVITTALNRAVEIDRMEFYKLNHAAIYTRNFWLPKRKLFGFPMKK